MKKIGHLFLLICLSFLSQNVQAQDFELNEFATGLNQPVDLQNAGDDRLFAVEKDGMIRIVNTDGSVESTPFLDITDRVVNDAGERGLLGLAFHPNYANNGFFYVNYTIAGGTSTVSRFSVTNDANQADPNSEMVMMSVEQPQGNHNGGCMQFGADGYLYIGFGDGGGSGDPQNNAQNTQKFLGKILRIDVDNGMPYSVPADNPFVNDANVLDEIWSIGWRNPWRFSFDRQTGDMWVGDVGQNSFEEIDFEPAGMGGRNYGWRCYEGFSEFNLNGCGMAGEYTDPVYDYPTTNSVGKSVTGGYVYRGAGNPDLVGHYIYGDFVSGRIWSLTPNNQGGYNNMELLDWSNSQLSAFGEDAAGELYVLALQEGAVYKVATTCSDFSVDADVTDITCNGDEDGSISIIPPDPNSTIVFQDGSTDFNLTDLAAGDYVATVTDSNGCTSEVTTTITEPNALEATTTTTDISCFGEQDGSISVTPSDDEATILFDNGMMDFDLTDLAAGDYAATITDANGCTTTISASIVEPDEIDFDLDLDANGNIMAPTGFASYQWFADGQVTNQTTSTFVIDMGSTFYVVVTDDNGCTFTSDEFFVNAINDIAGLTQFEVSPNPFYNQLFLRLNTETALQINLQILNMDGKILEEDNVQVMGEMSKTIDLANLPNGVYYLKLNQGDKVAVQRIVKQ